MTTNDDHLVAYHEAGHGVVAAMAGFQIRRLVLHNGSQDGARGFCELHDADEERDRDTAAYLRHLLAGAAAEQRLLGHYTERDRGDVTHAMTLARATVNDWTDEARKARATVAAAQALANASMRDDLVWCWVERVADALIKRRTLSGRDVMALRPEPRRR